MENGVVKLFAIANIGVILCRLPVNPFGLSAISCDLIGLTKINKSKETANCLITNLLLIDKILVIKQIYEI